MRRRGAGTIVNVSSLAGRVALPLTGAYTSSKWALEAISETLAFELGHFGVRVVVLEPGTVDTGAFEASPGHVDSDGAYAPLAEQLGRDRSSAPTTTLAVADAIVGAIEQADGPLRRPLGADAEQLLAARASMDDAQFDQTLRGALGLTW